MTGVPSERSYSLPIVRCSTAKGEVLDTVGMLTRALWEVRWVHNRRVIVVDFGDDFAEAVRIYTKALAGGRRDVTLRSKNAGFGPPKRLRPTLIQLRNGEVEKSEPLEHYNKRGWWWCPYCIHLRKFVKRNGFMCEGHYVREPGYHCPMCGISHRSCSVATWNPIARRLQADGVHASRTHKKRKRKHARS